MKTPSSPRILVIDDNAGLRLSLSRALEAAGYSVRSSANGQEGIEIAREFQPAVVICDMHMPQGNGSTVLAAMRGDERIALSQFILMTGDRDGTPQRVGMDLGADDYLAKPFTVDEFLKCVEARVQRSNFYQKAEERALLHFRETITHNLPHEVFTPLTGILGFTEVLRDEIGRISPEEAGKMVSEIHVSAERLYRTLKNYLRVLDVLNGQATLDLAVAHTPASEVADVVATAARGVTDKYERATDFTSDCAEVIVPISSANLSTIVTELVDNACKYSSKGTPIGLHIHGVASGVTLSVTDQGRGMTSEQVEQIGAFRQFDRKKYEQQGLGLGLTLTQQLVERHGGSFRLESSPSGTTVVAIWPSASELT